MLRNMYRLGMLAYLPLVVLAAVFYLERTAFIDVAYILFGILSSGQFAVQEYRFGSAITQAIMVAGGQLQLSLGHIAMAYSVGVIVYYAACYLFSGAVFKNYQVAVALLLCQTLFVAHSFYWIQAELAQGLAFMMAVFAWITSGNRKSAIAKYIVFPAAVVTVSFFHPLMFIPSLYLVVFFLLSSEQGAENKKILLAAAAIIMVSVAAKTFVFRSGYDSKTLESAQESLQLLPGYFSFDSTRMFLRNCIYKYYWIPVGSIMIIARYLPQKQYRKLLLYLLTLCAYLLLVNTSFRDHPAPFYMENLYLPIAVFIAVPLVYDVLPAMRPAWKYGLLVLIVAGGLARIYSTHDVYTARRKWQEDFLNKHREGKWVYDDSRVPMDTLIMNWGTPYEFWLLSTVKYGSTASIMVADNADAYIMPAFNRFDFLTPFGSIPYEELPPPYFRLTDTSSRYTVVRELK